jgi:hypothetical protein
LYISKKLRGGQKKEAEKKAGQSAHKPKVYITVYLNTSSKATKYYIVTFGMI